MSEPQSKPPVNDISHLFLSNVRELAGKGMPRPQRIPPGGQRAESAPAAMSGQNSGHAVDLSPEEYAEVLGGDEGADTKSSDEVTLGGNAAAVAPVTALLASHLAGRQLERARDYAQHLASSTGRVGLIDLDVSEFRLFCFDPAAEPGMELQSRSAPLTGICDPREIAGAVEELNLDVEQWLILVPNLRTPEARALLQHAERWVLLGTCDHDGVVAAYRTLKMVAEARQPNTELALAVLDAAGDAEAVRVHQKLAGVCRQFLNWDVESESPVRYAAGVAEHPLMNCRVSRDKAQLASAPHWAVVEELLHRPRRVPEEHLAGDVANTQATAVPVSMPPEEPNMVETHDTDVRRIAGTKEPAAPALKPTPIAAPVEQTAHFATPDLTIPPLPASHPTPMDSMRIEPAMPAIGGDDVLELLGDAADSASILAAVLKRSDWGMVECPVTPPMCPAGRLAVSRERGLVLIAAATRGLSELRAIGAAYRWMTENRALIAMAMPQFAIDAHRMPSLHLLVDQSDISGELLRPMMQTARVCVHAYRTLRWAGKRGLLLEAA
jgi:hypothetical protein